MTKHQNPRDFVAASGGDISEKEAEFAVEFLSGQEERYNIEVTVAGIAGYLKVTINMDVNGRSWFFEGNAGATTLVAVGKYWGHCYTKDVARLTKDSHGFNINAVSIFPAGYVNVNFFDGSSNFLGHAHAGGLTNLTCTGGGTGSWR
ncbi:MAG: VapA/VapB family virulence-associated protein [Candidatus Sphingomonas phytovorans]|nr:VapA/VapB family virulence-associated protein [Sphingomonas sp.]WEJ98196.1 MAG: VapA/VapB family virulence-associated protein [Sphingomonas sp.]